MARIIGGPASESGWEFERFVGELVAAMPGADVRHVRTRGQDLERGAIAVADQVVLAAGLIAFDRR
jgi:hypothetical protein